MGSYARVLIKKALIEPCKLLEEQKFWKLTVFQEFLDEITSRLYTDSPGALELAELGPCFAKLVATQQPHADLNVLLIRAYGHLGNAFRALSRFDEADQVFDRATALPGPAEEHADIDIRRAYLRVCQGRNLEAHECAHRAVEVFKKSDDLLNRHPLGLALIARGFTHHNNKRPGAAAVDLSAATGIINYRTKPRTYYYALHNLSVIMIETITPERLGQTLKNLEASYRRFIGYSQRHIAKYKIRWLQALAQKRFGATRQAEKYLKKAFNGFADIGAVTELILVALDITVLFVEEGAFEEAKQLAAETHKIVTRLGPPPGMLQALDLWRQADEVQMTPNFLMSVRSIVVTHAQPYGA